MLDPEEDPQTARPPPAAPQLVELVQLEVPSAGPRPEGDEEWTVQAETDPTHHVRR
jgi:hypothetical protein